MDEGVLEAQEVVVVVLVELRVELSGASVSIIVAGAKETGGHLPSQGRTLPSCSG